MEAVRSAEAEAAALVELARGGDREAFGALVQRFQNLAVATAWARLGDPERARDAAQDAFIDAFLHLGQLREAAAFPGWLRRIVAKHCDRQTRRRSFPADAANAEPPAADPDAGAALAAGETRAWLRRAIEALPEPERLAVALHYLGGESQESVACFLELPLSTVKKRLHTARARLRERSLETLMQPDPALRAEARPLFEAGISLFLAVRAGDRAAAGELLARHPELAGASEAWSVGEALERELPMPTRATPLILAAERGDLAMIELLLARGAPVDGPCDCAGHETPLWAALASGREAAALRLLEAGADPDKRAFAGHTPLHVAAIRGLAEAALALLARGADPAPRAASGDTPLDWARRNGHEEVAAALEGTQAARSPRAGAERALASASASPLYETGIKLLDLFAPLRRGDLVHWHGGPGLGRNVLLAELARRARLAPGTRTLWALWHRYAWEEGELEATLGEMGIEDAVEVLRAGEGSGDEARRGLAPDAAAAAERLLAEGAEHVVVALFRRSGELSDADAALPRFAREPGGPVTTFLLAPLREARERPVPALAAPLDAVIAFDAARAAAQLFPALDPLTSRSRGLAECGGAEHLRVADEARAHLAELRRFDAALLGRPLEEAPTAARPRLARARRLEAFLSQPFLATEAFTGRAGVHVSLADTVAGAAAILAGALDAVPVGELLYRGAVSAEPKSARARA
jgi:RNA polymerase sigma factor (sigma-70 family)